MPVTSHQGALVHGKPVLPSGAARRIKEIHRHKSNEKVMSKSGIRYQQPPRYYSR